VAGARRSAWSDGGGGEALADVLRVLDLVDGLVIRQVYAEVPPRVEYTLTGLGAGLIGPLDVIRVWTEENITAITECRARYDASAVTSSR
jgi:DNA-binding HxlR family transcriptional regulator